MMLMIGVAALSFIIGYAVAAYLIARDSEVVRLGPDEVIVKKPADGLVLIAVTQQVARRIVLSSGGVSDKSVLEARDIL